MNDPLEEHWRAIATDPEHQHPFLSCAERRRLVFYKLTCGARELAPTTARHPTPAEERIGPLLEATEQYLRALSPGARAQYFWRRHVPQTRTRVSKRG
jgi:hypothetical protein